MSHGVPLCNAGFDPGTTKNPLAILPSRHQYTLHTYRKSLQLGIYRSAGFSRRIFRKEAGKQNRESSRMTLEKGLRAFLVSSAILRRGFDAEARAPILSQNRPSVC